VWAHMLAMTDTAVQAINALVTANDLPEGAGIRIATADEQEGLALSIAAAPEQDDTVVSDGGASVFLEPTAAAALDDKVLDAQQVVADDQVQVRFAISQRD
jgi:iron-sulfur cluster assembly protein